MNSDMDDGGAGGVIAGLGVGALAVVAGVVVLSQRGAGESGMGSELGGAGLDGGGFGFLPSTRVDLVDDQADDYQVGDGVTGL